MQLFASSKATDCERSACVLAENISNHQAFWGKATDYELGGRPDCLKAAFGSYKVVFDVFLGLWRLIGCSSCCPAVSAG